MKSTTLSLLAAVLVTAALVAGQGRRPSNTRDRNPGRPWTVKTTTTTTTTPSVSRQKNRPSPNNGYQGNGASGTGNSQQDEDTRPRFVNIRERRRKQSGRLGSFPDELELTFPLEQEDVMLNLTWNYHMSDAAEVVIGTGPNKRYMRRWQSKTRQSFAVYTDENKKASIIIKEDTKNRRKLKYMGNFFAGAQEYVLEPADWDNPPTQDMAPLVYSDPTDVNMYMVHKLQPSTPEAGYETDERTYYTPISKYTFAARGEDVAMRVTGQANYGVQTLLVVDYALYEKWFTESTYQSYEDKMNDAIENIRFYFAHVMNGVDMRYRSIDDPNYKMYVTLGGYYIATTRGGAPFTQEHLTPGVPHGNIDTYAAIESLVQWLRENKDALPPHDQATLFTSDYLISSYSGNRILGLSNIGAICTDFGVTINRDEGLYSATQTGAHEMGHNLGAYHDGDQNNCSTYDQYIMATNAFTLTDDIYKNAFTFSPCSISDIKDKMKELNNQNTNCLLDEAQGDVNITQLINQLPGERYSPDEQCRVIFGEESFFCGGATEETRICRTMECFDTILRYCRATAEMRAAPGTTCGNKMWCQAGDCVYDQNARSAPDYCIYGDYTGPYKNGLNCYIIGNEKPWNCYNDYYLDDCCDTCARIKDSTRPDCPYGDKDETCQNIIPYVDCLDPDVSERCCRTCEDYINQPGYCVDKAAWCPEYIKTGSTCYYDTDNTCCATCKQFDTGIEGCQYGDKVSWCESYITKGSLCYRGYDTDCCATCQRFSTGIPGCEYGDKDACGDYVTAKDCYTKEDVCCETCRGLVVSDDPNCRYGDKEDYCLGLDPTECYTKSDICCYQCSLHETGIEGCEYGDRIRGCTQNDCYDPFRSSDCCETCRNLFTTPDPTCVDEASWCADLAPSYCYGVEKDICCQRCSSFYTGKPGCEYGDHHTWCQTIYCQSPTLKQECCATCGNDPSVPTASPTTATPRPTTTTTTPRPTTTTTTTIAPPSQVCTLPDASWCYDSSNRVWPRDCLYYSTEGTCCNMCQMYYSGDPNCPFGDEVDWCIKYVFSPSDCSPDILSVCCQTCKDVL